MDKRALTAERRNSVWLDETAGTFDTFKALVEQKTQLTDWPNAAEIASNIPIYDGATVRALSRNATDTLDLLAEWNTAFDAGPATGSAATGAACRFVRDDLIEKV